MNSVYRSLVGATAVALLAASCAPSSTTKGGVPVTPSKFVAGPANVLAVKEKAKVKEPVDVPFNGTMDLNFKTRDEVLGMRTNMAMRNTLPQLLDGGVYRPTDVFDGIKDDKTWIGLKGRTFYSNTYKCIEGLAEESRFLCTPYLLVAADVRNTAGEFDRNRYPDMETIANSQFPQQCPPKKIILDPVNATEVVDYDVTSYRNSCNVYLRRPISIDKVEFGLTAYNARDFGYRWMYVQPEPLSSRVQKYPRLPHGPFEIKQNVSFVGYNDMIGDSEDFQRYQFMSVPARLVISLWKAKPQSATDPSDFTVTLNFK